MSKAAIGSAKTAVVILSVSLIMLSIGCDTGSSDDESVKFSEVKITPFDGAAGDRFGTKVALNGSYLVSSATGDADEGAYTGAVYIYRRTGENTWDAGTKITASDKAAGDYFGTGCSISGDYIVVGSGFSDSWAGSAYIYRRTGENSWDSEAIITASDGEANEHFGSAVSISGDYAVIGARDDDDNGDYSGSAYVYRRTGENTWDSEAKILASDGTENDSFGSAVSISSDYFAAGAPGDVTAKGTGSAYVFRRTGPNTWDEGTKILPYDGSEDHRFGTSVSISGDYLVVGAPYDEDNGNMSGSAYIYRRTGENTWDAGTKITASDGEEHDHFGQSVCICGDYLIVGAEGNNDGAGAAYIFRRTGTNSWEETIKITASDRAMDDNFGSVSIYNDYAAVGAPHANSDTGAVYSCLLTGL